jgi:solute carrier family 23 (nucleobase transporter), member 1
MVAGSIIMMILGVLGKFGAIFVTIPEPIVGGVFITIFGEHRINFCNIKQDYN